MPLPGARKTKSKHFRRKLLTASWWLHEDSVPGSSSSPEHSERLQGGDDQHCLGDVYRILSPDLSIVPDTPFDQPHLSILEGRLKVDLETDQPTRFINSTFVPALPDKCSSSIQVRFIFSFSKKKLDLMGAWVAQLAERPTPDFGSGHDLTVCDLEL